MNWKRIVVQQSALEEASEFSVKEAHQIVFINARNEWAEGNHLEPDAKHGCAHLDATRTAVKPYKR